MIERVRVEVGDGGSDFFTKLETGVRLSLRMLSFFGGYAALVTLLAVMSFRYGAAWGWAWSLLPLWVMLIPLTGLGFYWVTLEGVSQLPQILRKSPQTIREIGDRLKKRNSGEKIRGIGPIATFKRVKLTMGILWDSRELVEGAFELQGLMQLASPLFWIVLGVCLAVTFLLSLVYSLLLPIIWLVSVL